MRASAHEEGDSHPAHIHVGTCAALGEIVFPLSNVGMEFQSDGTPMAGPRPARSPRSRSMSA